MNISNIDSFFFSMDFEEYNAENKELLNTLAELKEKAQEDRMIETYITLNCRKFKLLPNGSRFHAYILHNDSLEIKVASNRSKSKNNFPVAIRLKSMLLWEKGFLDAYMETEQFITSLFNGEVKGNKISRADLCCHTDDLFPTSNLEVWRGRFRKIELFTYNRAINGLVFGSFKENNVMCRIYDKTLEIKSSGKAWFNEIWSKQDMNINNVWNIEFQVGRKFFKEHNIESSQDFIIQMRGIWEKLTGNWINLVNLDDDRKSRCSVHDTWLEVQKAFKEFCLQEPIKREKLKEYDAKKLMPLLVGVLTSYGASYQQITLYRVLDQFKEDLKEYLEEKKDNVPLEQLFLDKLEYIFEQ